MTEERGNDGTLLRLSGILMGPQNQALLNVIETRLDAQSRALAGQMVLGKETRDKIVAMELLLRDIVMAMRELGLVVDIDLDKYKDVCGDV